MKIMVSLSAAEAPGTSLSTFAAQSLYFGFDFSSRFTRSLVVGVNCVYAKYATLMCPRSFQPNAGPQSPAVSTNPSITVIILDLLRINTSALVAVVIRQLESFHAFLRVPSKPYRPSLSLRFLPHSV